MLNRRPKSNEDEDDILRMQEEFLREKNKNQNLQPAAQVVNLRPTKRPSTDTKPAEPDMKKPSKYAKIKGLKSQSENRQTEASTSSVMGDIVEKNIEDLPENSAPEVEDDKVYFPKPIPTLLGDIIERNTDGIEVDFTTQPMPPQGFPAVTKWDPSKRANRASEMDVDPIDQPSTSRVQVPLNVPPHSVIVSSKDADQIHKENVKLIGKMSEKEILEDQQKLMSSLDPKLIEFLKAKRRSASKETEPKSTADKTQFPKMDTSEDKEPGIITNKTERAEDSAEHESLWENDVISHPQVANWLHFDSLEKDKLEWMKGIEKSKSNIKEPYEARFNFKGYLLPYTMEYTEETKTLFHHGEEPHRPGYSLTELFELSRSTVNQQRVMALNTVAGILEYYMAGTYKDVLTLPLSKIFFIVRFAMDENKAIILEPALKAMRNLLYNRIDEASLDTLLGLQEGNQQPSLENDKSEIEELESNETELKDFHLAEIDLISAALRTDILQRIFYILDTIRPSFNCVQYALQILTRLARDSVETAAKIVESDHLMQTVIKNFVPSTSINFVSVPNPQKAYTGKPVLAALKLLRVLSLQSKEISEVLVSKYNIQSQLSIYISSGVDGTYGLRLQIEAFCIFSNLLHFGIVVEEALSLSQIIVTTLFKHVQMTDVLASSSVKSATHASVVLQFVNNLLSCTVGLDSLKQQVYPLIKEGTQKWLAQITVSENYTCAHLRLLCAALDCCKTMMVTENLQMKFLNDSLKVLIGSKGFKEIVKNLVPSSNLLSGIGNRDLHKTDNLMSLGSSVIDSAQKVLPILNVASPIPFLASLFNLLTLVDDRELALIYLNEVSEYLRRLENRAPSLCENWFTRIETDLVFSMVKLSIQSQIPEASKDSLYIVANKLCYILRSDKKYELEYLFNNIVFNKQWFTAERLMKLVSITDAHGFSKVLSSIEDIKLHYSRVINVSYRDIGPSVVLRKWREPILPRDWIYLPILMLYSRSQDTVSAPKVVGEHAKKVAAHVASEKESIISCSLEWILFNELCFPDLLNDISATDRLCRIMCVFLCDNSLFLEPEIKTLLQKCTQILFKKKAEFNFDKQLTGLNNFQDFYTQFLEQFQSVSYGDPTFAACVAVPIAQCHNAKWRKLLWSEYAGCLRALDCPEHFLCYEINDYFHPEETDESLIKSYMRALSSNLLRPNTLAHKIACYHAEAFGKRNSNRTPAT